LWPGNSERTRALQTGGAREKRLASTGNKPSPRNAGIAPRGKYVQGNRRASRQKSKHGRGAYLRPDRKWRDGIQPSVDRTGTLCSYPRNVSAPGDGPAATHQGFSAGGNQLRRGSSSRL